MYLKLALRSARRSAFDYLLYMVTMSILITIMFVSNCIALVGEMQAGFQTISLPLLIVLIMAALVNYINTFMMKQRAKEIASYLLMGMEKNKLTRLFLSELGLIGSVCLGFGVLLGVLVCFVISPEIIPSSGIQPLFMLQSVLYTFLYVCLVEVLSAILLGRKMRRLEIRELMNEKYRSQSLRKNNKKRWAALFVTSMLLLLLFVAGIVVLPEDAVFLIISFVSLPLLFCIFAFYKWIYAYFSEKRLLQADGLWQGNRLYRIAELTTGTKTSALMSAVFCICLLFAAMSFIFGSFMINPDVEVLDYTSQRWMGFLQISICIIFIVIYFSILTMQQIIEVRQQEKNIRIMHYMGKSRQQVEVLVYTQILLKMFIPTLMCFVVLMAGTPFINYKINMSLPYGLQNFLVKAVGGFIGCFAVLYLCYFLTAYIISRRFLKKVF